MTPRARASCALTSTALGPIVIAVAFLAMIAFTGERWTDPLVDFGRELYVPWQIASGKVLYRDIAHFNGPLSQYFNALIFRVFGASLRILVLTNIAIAIAMLVMIWKLFRLAGDRLSATVACLIFIALFMALQYVSIGNYNWITPYSHELTHGLALSLAGILALLQFRVRPRRPAALVCGALLGLIFLTKPEIFFAAAVVIIGGFIFAGGLRKSFILAFLCGLFAPPIISIIVLALAMPVQQAVRGVLGGWTYAGDPRLRSMWFYKIGMGLDTPAQNLFRAVYQAGAYLLLIGPAVVLDRITAARALAARAIAAGIYVVVVLAILRLLDARELIPWHDCLRGLSVILLVASIAAIFWLDKRTPKNFLRAELILFSTLLLAKIFLASRAYHYGFVLALPATLVFSAMCLNWIPSRRFALITKAAALALIGMVIYHDVSGYARSFRIRPIIVAAGTSDEFRADDRGAIANAVLAGIDRLPANATLAVLPQGVMLNYLSGHANPTPFVTLMPPEVTMFGDEAIASAYAHHPPDFVIIIPEQFGEYGFASFEAFAPKTAEWIRSNYSPIATLHHADMPIVLLHRNQ